MLKILEKLTIIAGKAVFMKNVIILRVRNTFPIHKNNGKGAQFLENKNSLLGLWWE